MVLSLNKKKASLFSLSLSLSRKKEISLFLSFATKKKNQKKKRNFLFSKEQPFGPFSLSFQHSRAKKQQKRFSPSLVLVALLVEGLAGLGGLLRGVVLACEGVFFYFFRIFVFVFGEKEEKERKRVSFFLSFHLLVFDSHNGKKRPSQHKNSPFWASELALARTSSASCAFCRFAGSPCHVRSTEFCSARA